MNASSASLSHRTTTNGDHKGTPSLAAEPHHPSHPKYRSDIDGLRAIAVGSVVAFHAFPNWLPGGYVGVDVFFVISGFLISSIIFGNLERGTFSYADFYARRIRRIFPALMLVLATTWLVGWYVLLSDEYKQAGKHIGAGAGFISNLVLWSESGYFDTSADAKPLLHLWSLGVEEQFYIVWPVLLGLVWRFKHEFLRITLVIAIASFALNIFTVTSNPVAAYYSPLSRFWELMIGGLLAYMVTHTPHYLTSHQNLRAVAGLLMIVVGALILDEASKFPGWWALLPTIGTALLISVGPTTWINRYILGHRWMVFVGLISYPLYLWHWPLLSFARIIEGGTPSRNVRIMLVVASFVLAWLTYAVVEKKLKAASGKTVVTVFASIAAVLFVGGTLSWLEVSKPRNAGEDLELVVQAFEDWQYPPEDFQTSQAGGLTVYSKAGSGGSVLFLGDSHIQQYAPRIGKLLGEDPKLYKSAVFATTGGCPPIPSVFEDQHAECENWLSMSAKLAHEDTFDSVVIGACWDCYFIDMARKKDTGEIAQRGPGSYEYYYMDNGTKKYFRTGDGVEPALASLENFIKKLTQYHRVFLVLDNPMGAQFHPKTFFQGTRLTKLLYTDSPKLHELTKEQQALKQTLTGIAERANAIVIDPIAHMCSNDLCSTTMDDGRPMYKDSNHFRRLYSENHASFIDVAIRNSL